MSAKKNLKIALVVLQLGLILLAGAAALYVQTRSFNQFLLRQLISSIEQSTGLRLEVQSLKLRWSPFSGEFFGIVAHGKEGPLEPPLLRADRLKVSLGLRALLRREIDLHSIELDRPIVNARIGTAGNSNLPETRSNAPSNFTMVVRHAALRDGVVQFNDQRVPLTAEVDDLNVRMTYDPPSGTYHGDAAYRNGQFATLSVNATPHTARIQFAVNRSLLEVEQLEIRSKRSQFELVARIENFADPRLEGNYRGRIDALDLADVLQSTGLPHGQLAVSGTLNYKKAREVPFLSGLQIEGRLESPELAIRLRSVLARVEHVRATYRRKRHQAS
jgi:translocation and assembly module TamB